MSEQLAVRCFRRGLASAAALPPSVPARFAWAALTLLLASLWLVAPAAVAAPPRPAAEVELPGELLPWVGWVRAGDPDRRCAREGEQARCLWQGVLSVDLRPGGADFVLQVVLDKAGAVPLVGGPGAWPTNVRERTTLVPVLAEGEVPTVRLERGMHVLQGSLRWARPPATLRVPPAIGVLRLSRGGARLPAAIGADGVVRLGGESAGAGDDATLGIDVSRRIVDDVPVLVVTHIAIRASGAPREVDLGQVLLEGATAVQLDADLPARLDEQGRLSVQVRPGSFFVEIRSIQEGPVLSLTAPASAAAGWPEREFWVLEPDEGVRAVEVSGAPGIDPQRASLPEGWGGLATWMMTPGTTLQFKELRRGQPVVPPNTVAVRRRLWLDPDGGGWTIADSLSGALHQGWRLQAAAPLALGSVRVGGQPQVITTIGEVGGVEVRSAALSLDAESRVEGARWSLPAVGWQLEARQLDVDLLLPPGWRLITALGPDEVRGAWLQSWSLMELLIVILAVGLVARIEGWRWAPLGLLALMAGEPSAGAAIVVLLLGGLRALEAAISAQALGGAARWLRRIAAALALLGVGAACALELRDAALPSTRISARVDGTGGWAGGGLDGGALNQIPDRFVQLSSEAVDVPKARGSVYRQSKSVASSEYDNMTLQLDPGAVVQTGPGLPTWHGSSGPTATLRWEGAVGADQALRIVALSPGMALLQTILHSAALLFLLLRLSRAQAEGWLRPGGLRGASAALLLAVALSLAAPRSASAAPDPELLRELGARVAAPPSCRPNCASVSLLDFRVGSAEPRGRGGDPALIIGLEVHAGEDVAVPLPGPAAIWAPDKVLIDNVPTAALSREADGFVRVRVPAGVHRVLAIGPLPERGALTLQVGLPPQRASMSGEGWALRGLRPDGGVERSVQLVREADGEAGAERSADNLAPWILVRRFVDLGVPWRVRTTVSRVGPSLAPLALRVPLLEGEAVTVDGLQVQGGAVLVSLDQDVSKVEWTGTLLEREQLVLKAPSGVPWTEEWALSCSPVFHCEVEAGVAGGVPAPFSHVFEGRWTPQWRPWPGESLQLRVSRPPGAPGQTLTIHSAKMDVSWRGRQRDVSLRLHIATSQGGQHRVRLPEGATLSMVDMGGASASLELTGGWLTLPLKPGPQDVQIEWRSEGGPSVVISAPDVDLGAPVSNLELRHRGLDGRWLLGAAGGGWGPHVVILPMLLIWGCVAVALRQALWMRGLWGWLWGPAPLLVVTLGLVGQGSALPALLALLVIAAHGALVERQARGSWGQLLGLMALGAAVVLLLSLAGAVIQGVAKGAANAVVGNGSSPGELVWSAYRAPSTLISATVISLPGWVGQVVYLAWSAALLKLAPPALRRWWADLRWSFQSPPRPPGGGGSGAAPDAGGAEPLPKAPLGPVSPAAAEGEAAAGGFPIDAIAVPAAAAVSELAASSAPSQQSHAAPVEREPPAPAPPVAAVPPVAAPPIEAGEAQRPRPYPPVSPVEPPQLPVLPTSALLPGPLEDDSADLEPELSELPSLPGTAAKVRMGDPPLPAPRRSARAPLPEPLAAPTPTEDDEISALLGGVAEPALAMGEE